MEIDKDQKTIAMVEKQKKKRRKEKEKVYTAESTEDAQFDERKTRKNAGDGVTEAISEKENDIESISDDKEKKEKKEKKKKKKKKKIDGDEAENNESTVSSMQELIETKGDQDNGKKKKAKDGKSKFLSTEVDVQYEAIAKEGKSSGNSSMKAKGTVSHSGGTDTKKRKQSEQEEGGSSTAKSLKKAKKTAKDEVEKNASDINSEIASKKKSKSKKVSFSGEDDVFPFTKDDIGEKSEEYDESQLVRGKRFSKEEDQLIRDAVENYIRTNQLGENGLQMVLKCSKHPEVKGCWLEISAAIPWRPLTSVWSRAHIIYERSEKRGFSQEEKEVIRKFHAEFGPQWKKLSEVLGKQRIHVKDAWRSIRLPNIKKGHWSQDEYQTLFDMVNLDLRIKAFRERKSDNVMLREDISWEAISDKISTRTMSSCCHKWYDQLRSPLVARGVWADSDDYRLLDALQKQDACNVEEVDWGSLLERRSEEVCRQRWDEMVRHIGGHRERTFIEQVDVLNKRYCGDMPQYRFKHQEANEEEEEE